MKQAGQKAKRKQIYLYPWEEELITNHAEKAGKTESAVIRESIVKQLAPRGGKKPLTFFEVLERLSRGTEKMKIPRDLSERHDYYYAEDEIRRWKDR